MTSRRFASTSASDVPCPARGSSRNAERPLPIPGGRNAAFLACGGRLSSNPVCLSVSPAGGCGPCGLHLPLRERSREIGARGPRGTNLQTRTTARCRALRRRGLPVLATLRRLATRTTLPRDGCPPLAPLAVPNVAEAVTPISAGLQRFQAREPFPACGVVLDHPASNDAKCSAPGAHFQATYDAFRAASRTLEVRPQLSSPRETARDKTRGVWDLGLCAVFGKDEWGMNHQYRGIAQIELLKSSDICSHDGFDVTGWAVPDGKDYHLRRVLRAIARQ